MKRAGSNACGWFCFFAICLTPFPATLSAADTELDSLLAKFTQYTGVELVFARDDLPEGRYHDVMKPLDDARKIAAAKVCIQEARLYPPRYFAEAGLKTIGVFAACVSKTTTDKHREYDEQLGGYRYYGVYNGNNAIAASFYSEGQLGLTFHHEIFHHIDSTVDGVTEKWLLSNDDAFFRAAVSGMKPYTAPPIPLEDLQALRKARIGITLKDAVSEYAAKNPREDQAETARHVMSMLASSIVQAIDRPELAGSQRILHVLREYELAVPDGPGLDWFVDVALKRANHELETRSIGQLIADLKEHSDRNKVHDPDEMRTALRAVVRVDTSQLDGDQASELVILSAKITSALLRQRIAPDVAEERFDVWGQEDAKGVNHTLRNDVLRFGADAKRLALIGSLHPSVSQKAIDAVAQVQLDNLRLIARYYVFIKATWSVTAGTKKAFESAKTMIVSSLPAESSIDAESVEAKSLDTLANQPATNSQF